jgi:hypothetical protein
MLLLNSLVYLQHYVNADLNFFKLKSGDSWKVTSEMYPLFQDLTENQRGNLLRLLFFKHE